MAKFSHAAKWDRREQSRKARETANATRMDDLFDLGGMRPVITVVSEAAKAVGSATVLGDSTLVMKLGGNSDTMDMVRGFNKFVKNLGAVVAQQDSETDEERAAREARIQSHIARARIENLKSLAFKKVSKGEFDEELLSALFEPEQVERLRIQAGQIMTIRDQITSKFLETGLPPVVTTVGVYPNGPSKTNGVALEDLPYHIWYNANFRPGRGLIINRQIWFHGGAEAEKLEAERLKYAELVYEYSTAPYH